jgi:DNA-binding CsgD family transcriptional regulator
VAFGNHLLATRARLTLARLSAARGDFAQAQRDARIHLDACSEGGHATWLPGCLDALGEIAAGTGADADAVRLLAAAEHARRALGIVRVIPEPDRWVALDARLHAALGDEHATVAAQGAGLTLDEAVAWARRMRGPRARARTGWPSLTPTERRVAELAALGLSNPQIGERMFVSPETVKTHMTRIFHKLSVRNRAELAALAARHDGA